jgi:hypothetical protein
MPALAAVTNIAPTTPTAIELERLNDAMIGLRASVSIPGSQPFGSSRPRLHITMREMLNIAEIEEPAVA